MNLRTVSDQTDLFRVPSMALHDMIIVSPEMPILKQHPLHAIIVLVDLAKQFDPWQIVFVDHLVRLQVQQPVAGAMRFGQVRLLCMDRSVGKRVNIPLRFNDLDLI